MHLRGQYADLCPLADGRLLMTYVMRDASSPSIQLRIGNADGSAWQADDALVVYNQTRDDLRDARQGYDDYLRSMATWSFGWPCTIQLADGSLLAAYYTGCGKGSGLRIARISMGQQPPAAAPAAAVSVRVSSGALPPQPALAK
jgi:hypothetical protein